jgi:hypothetical protein
MPIITRIRIKIKTNKSAGSMLTLVISLLIFVNRTPIPITAIATFGTSTTLTLKFYVRIW